MMMIGLCLSISGAVAEPSPRKTPLVLAVERATPSVVAVDTEVPVQSVFGWHRGTTQGQGSGVVLTQDGVVLTNAHVVEGASSITIHTAAGDALSAELMALDRSLDLAVLKVDSRSALVPIALANSDDLYLGETTIAIGNPLGLGLTVSTGVVSSTSRTMEIQQGLYQDYIQTDAAINPGNSGGALVDLEGRLIGINTFIRRDAEGIGFAIPVNRAKKVADDLVRYGAVKVPWLGCDLVDIHPRRLAGTRLAKGVVQVLRVHDGSACASVGIREGDLLFEIDGRPT